MGAPKIRLPLHVFEKMVANLGPADLVKIPPAQLPLYIPADFINTVPEKSMKAVETLLFEAEANRMDQRMIAESAFGDQLGAALDVASSGGSPVLYGVFPKKFEEAKTKTKTELSKKELDKIVDHLEALSAQIMDDAQGIVKALDILASVKEKPSEISVYLQECYDTLLTSLKHLHHKMDEYALFRLKLLGPKLQKLGERAKSAANELVQLKHGIPETEKHIKSIVKTQNVRPEQMGTHPQIQSLQQQLVTLKARKETLEVLVSKEELYKNLDLITNGVLISGDSSKKIAHYCYQLWTGVKELVVDFVRAALPPNEYTKVTEHAQQFLADYFTARQVFLAKTMGEYFPRKQARLNAAREKFSSEM